MADRQIAEIAYNAAMPQDLLQDAPVLGLILAGGHGRRMGGAAKPLLSLEGKPLIQGIIERMQGQCAEMAINLHDLQPETIAPFSGFGLPLVADALPGHAGPLAGVLAGLDHAARSGLSQLVSLPCDCPFLPDDLVARLFQAARSAAHGFARAASGGREHPVIALWPVRCRENLRRALAEEGLRKVGEFQQRYDVATAEWFFRARDPFFNINRPDDFTQATELARADETSRGKLSL
jgi:molybdopterin-guanine dinucleotide biosynthesis protein A